MMRSAIYEGTLRHDRLVPRPHSFRRRLFWMYLDLDELPDVFRGRWLWSDRRPNLAWFRRADYLGPPERPLKEAVLERVERELGRRPRGPVRVLTHLRTFGYVFNPVTFYYCFDERERLDAVVAEITNTPWNERHAYVLAAGGRSPGAITRADFAKDFHVSPFFGLDQVYRWSFRVPDERLDVRMANEEHGRTVFTARLDLVRRPLTAGSLARALVRHPLLTLRVHAAIYVQAGLLWLKRTPFFPHPSKRPTAVTTR